MFATEQNSARHYIMKPENPMVSIVIPVYNGSNYLAQAINSALAQTYPYIEILVIDDGSDDAGKTREIALSYSEKVRYIFKKNGGVSSALNYGIKEMRGSYFSWLSHDDRYHPNKIERQIAFFKRHSRTMICGSGFDVIDHVGNINDEYLPEDLVSITNGRMIMDCWVFGCSLLIDKVVFKQVSGFDENSRTVQDLDLWLKMVYHGIPIYLLPENLCQWRLHSASDSFRIRSEHFEEMEFFFEGLLSRYPLCFFSDKKYLEENIDHAAVYLWLGNQAKQRGAFQHAGSFYRRSLLLNWNPFSDVSRKVYEIYLSQWKSSLRQFIVNSGFFHK